MCEKIPQNAAHLFGQERKNGRKEGKEEGRKGGRETDLNKETKI
jgi:hypothetical protein